MLLFITYTNIVSISIADEKTPQMQQQKKYMVEIIAGTEVYNMEDALYIFLKIFSIPECTPISLLNDGKMVIQYTEQHILAALLMDLMAFKLFMMQLASNLNQQNKNQVLNSEVIRSLLLVILGIIIYDNLQNKEVSVANKKVLEVMKKITQQYLNQVANGDALKLEADTIISLREAIVSFLLAITNDPSIKIMINDNEINKAILQDKGITDLILTVANLFMQQLSTVLFAKIVSDKKEEVSTKSVEEK